MNTVGDFFLIMCNIDKAGMALSAIMLDELQCQLFFACIQSVQRFVQNDNLWSFDENANQQHQALLTVGNLQKGTFG